MDKDRLGLTAKEAADIVDPVLAKELADKRRTDARRDAERKRALNELQRLGQDFDANAPEGTHHG